MIKEYEPQQKQIKETEGFINRFKAKATKAKQVQSRVKALEKLDKVDAPNQSIKHISIEFSYSKEPGKLIYELNNVAKSYPKKTILKGSNAVIKRGDKIALLGANGLGKSTLLTLLNNHSVDEGEIKLGHNVSQSFYAQHQLESLDLSKSILDELSYTVADKTEQEIRNALGALLFTNDDIDKRINVLSGGEKARVALTKILLADSNFLLLDEPTNHLDIQSINNLANALINYPGSFITVSHNRHFIRLVANKIWYLENQQIHEYPGTYEEYEDWLSNRKKVSQTNEKIVISSSTPKNSTHKNSDFKKLEKERKKLQRDIEKVEKEIEQLEVQKGNIEILLTNPEVYNNSEKLTEQSILLKECNSSIEQLIEQWEELQLAYEKL